MAICTFCGKEIERGTGKMLVKTDGRIINLCSTKCEKNMFKLKRKPREQKWTQEAAKAKKTVVKIQKSE